MPEQICTSEMQGRLSTEQKDGTGVSGNILVTVLICQTFVLNRLVKSLIGSWYGTTSIAEWESTVS